LGVYGRYEEPEDAAGEEKSNRGNVTA
jgi:hypothetical protein